MSNNVNEHILKDLFNLVFFSSKGNEIYMQKEYTIEWEFVPDNMYANNFLSTPKGFIAGEISEPNEDENPKIPELLSIVLGITEHGKFTHNTLNDNFAVLFSGDDAKIKFKLNNNKTPQFFELPQNSQGNTLFNFTFDKTNITTSNGDKIYGNVSDVSTNYEEMVKTALQNNFKNIAFYFPFIKYVGDYYQDSVSTGFIAADTFMVLAKNNSGKDMDTDIFHRPHIGNFLPDISGESEFAPYITVTKKIETYQLSNNNVQNGLLGGNLNSLSRTFQLVFQPTNNSEIFILKHDTNYNLITDPSETSEFAADLFNVEEQFKNNPINFGVGFKAQNEGCYQNFLGIYLRNKDNDQSFFMGLLNIKTTVEGEDERFRTLLTNFGIPDPVKYSNIFQEVDYEEAGYDYKVINKKSKELFLTYDKIFSYVGTYKALLNAVKFLGYSDIVFKEWYKFRDIDNNMHNLAVRRIDMTSENYVKFHDEYGIDFEKYINYTKLNKLTMIYHLNEVSDDEQYIEYKQHFIIDGKDVYQTQYMYDFLPNVVPIYELRNDEILAKLFGVKEWLEAHVIGVGAYISDISGEGIYVGGIKTQTYPTLHHLSDYHKEEYVTPVITNIEPFEVNIDNNSGIYGSLVNCTLTEYTGLTFEDYQNVTFESFERIEIPVEIGNGENKEIIQLKIGNPFETPVLFDEIEYSIDVKNGSGTVHEFKSNELSDNNTELYVSDGEITLLTNKFSTNKDILPEFESVNNTSITSSFKYNYAPTIFIETGTIRDIDSNDWLDNVLYSINEQLSESGEVYKVVNIHTQETVGVSSKTIILKPHVVQGINRTYGSFKYTMDNKFDTPMIIISNYDMIIGDVIVTLSDSVIIDIITGRIEFYKQQADNDLKLKTEIFFSDDNRYDENDLLKFVENPREQVVKIQYEYTKDRIHLIEYTQSFDPYNANHMPMKFDSLQDALDTLESITEINAKNVEIPINRTGDYSVKVKTYDKYNNIFTSKSDKLHHVETLPIDINVYVKDQSFSNNDKSIYPSNINGTLIDLTNDTTYDLLDNIFSEQNVKTNYHYHSQNIEFDPANPGLLEYLNISYALDTPKNNEHILLYPTKISRPYKDSETMFVQEVDTYEENNIRYYDFVDEYGEIHDHLKCSNPINSDTQYQVFLDYNYFYRNFKISGASYSNDENETKSSIIIIGSNDKKTPLDVFKTGDVIKLKYVLSYVTSNDNETEIIYKTYENSLCYRILDTENNTIVLNGWIDDYIVGLKGKTIVIDDVTYTIKLDVYMSYPHEETSYYDVEITEDADEYKTYINNIPYLKTNVKFNDKRLFINDYLDMNYQLYLYDFDPTNFENIWWKNINPKNTLDRSKNYYMYKNFPITCERNSQILVEASDNYYVDTVPYHEWIWQTYYVETGENYDNYKTDETLNILFKSTNDRLNVYPDMQGRQDIILKSVDKFGNTFKNNGEGLVFMK